jgi:hypothetical protein
LALNSLDERPRRTSTATAGPYLHSGIDRTTKNRAAKVLKIMRLSISAVLRPLMASIVSHTVTRRGITELESGNGNKFAGVEDLTLDLHAED